MAYRRSARTLKNLGYRYSELGQTEKAIGLYERALTIAQEANDRAVVGNTLSNLGEVLTYKGEYRGAITRFKMFLPRVIESSQRRDFALVMAEFISPLNNAHSRYLDSVLFNHTPDLGFRMRYLDNEWVVTESFVDSIAAGDVVLSIDGVAMDEWYERPPSIRASRVKQAAGFSFRTGCLLCSTKRV